MISLKKRNTKIDKTIGPKFKEIRKEAHVSLKELAQKVGVVSPSTLSRWKRGEEGLPVEIFEKLLTSMNISYNEIIASEVDINQVIARIEYDYQKNKTEELKKLSLCLLDKYHQARDEFSKVEYLLKSAMAMNYYLDLSGVDLSDDEYKKALAKQFEYVNYWFEREIILFGNVQLLLDADSVYKLSRSLASKIYDEDLIAIRTSNTLLNAVVVLIKKKHVKEAQLVLNVITKLNISPIDLLTKVRIKYMQVLLNYIDTDNEYEISQFLNSLEDEYLKESWKFATAKIKEIYKL